MRTRVGWLGLVLAGCQSYDFAYVEPFTYQRIEVVTGVRAPRADVLVLLDRSGSMGFPIDAANPACPASCGQNGFGPCAAGCPTRVSELRTAMAGFFDLAKTQARFGLALFPLKTSGATIAEQCLPAGAASLVEALPEEGAETAANLAQWSAQTERIASYIGTQLQVGGGTPTTSSLDFVGATRGLSMASPLGRERIVLLLTDGLPNCQAPAYPDLDPTAVTSIARLKANGIRTMVVGFGGDVLGGTVLNDMARAGGFPRTCRTAADCGGSACGVDGVCAQAAYTAANAEQLKAVLESLRTTLEHNPCVVKLGSLPAPNLVVSRDRMGVAAGDDTWQVNAERSELRFVGQLCRDITESTASAPVNIEVGAW